eukprot:GHRR01004704.1.p1 GENE.GHRR01004704.1~~GHRR01004704.1.p1  ORF type:complete len:208 (+),score=72.30 GHRR01004704.1:301-924(+)
MSNEQRTGREVIENGLRNIGSYLKARGLPGKARLNIAQQPPLSAGLYQQTCASPSRAQGSRQGPASRAAGAASQALNNAAGQSAGAAAADGVIASIDQLFLQERPVADSHAVSSSTPAAASTSASDACVSQSRASSSIRVAKFHKVLNEQLIDLDALRELSWSGIPQELRPVCWRLLLGYLPPNRCALGYLTAAGKLLNWIALHPRP